MFTAERASRRRTRNEVLQPVDGAGRGRIAVHGERQAVEEGILGVLDAAFKQVDNGLGTAVLEFLQTGNGDRDGRLPDRIFRRRKRLARGDIQGLVAGISPVIACLFMTRFYTSPCSSDYIFTLASVGRSWTGYSFVTV